MWQSVSKEEVSPEDNSLSMHTYVHKHAHAFLKDGWGAMWWLFIPSLCHKHKGFFGFHENCVKCPNWGNSGADRGGKGNISLVFRLKDERGLKEGQGNVGHGYHRQKKALQHVIPQSHMALKSAKTCWPFTNYINYILKSHTNCTGTFSQLS